jgi:peptidylprolyl isomerase
VNRDANTNAYIQTYVTPTEVRTGAQVMNIRFFAEAGGTGAVVAEATRNVIIRDDGEILDTNSQPIGAITLEGKVASVEIPAGQNLLVGESKEIAFVAKDANGAQVAVSRGSASFGILDGATNISFTEDGIATGVALGASNIVAIVDEKTSPVTAIQILPKTVSVTNGQTVLLGETKPLSVTGTDASDNAITIPEGLVQVTVTEGTENVTTSENGRITGAKLGTAKVKVAVLGEESVEQSLAVRPKTVVITANQSVMVGETKPLTVTGTDASDNPIALPESAVALAVTKNPENLSVPENGKVFGIGIGTANVKATVFGTESTETEVKIDFGAEIATGSGLVYQEMRLSNSELSPKSGKQVAVHYVGYLTATGQKFDSSIDRGQPFIFTIDAGQVIPGFNEGVKTMKVGGQRRLLIPPQLGYGATGIPGVIPPNADLTFDIQLLDAQQ